MAMFKAFKPSGMEKIARAMGYQGNMQGFQSFLSQDPMRQQQMQQYQQMQQRQQQMQGNEGGQSNEDRDGEQYATQEIQIPSPEEFQTPEEYRRALLEGMEADVPEEYEALKKRYYEELVRQ